MAGRKIEVTAFTGFHFSARHFSAQEDEESALIRRLRNNPW
jgi:hypothetical protein